MSRALHVSTPAQIDPDRVRNVLSWIDFCSPAAAESARKSCRGRKDVERLRTRLRAAGRPESFVSLMTEAAQRRDTEFMLRIEWVWSPRQVVVHPRRAVLR